MNKKGLSDVVTSVLLILLAIAAIAIVWLFVGGFLLKQNLNLDFESNLEIKKAEIDSADSNLVYVTVKSISKDVDKLKFVFYDSLGNTKVVDLDSPLKELQQKEFTLEVSEFEGEITKVQVYSVYIENGDEKVEKYGAEKDLTLGDSSGNEGSSGGDGGSGSEDGSPLSEIALLGCNPSDLGDVSCTDICAELFVQQSSGWSEFSGSCEYELSSGASGINRNRVLQDNLCDSHFGVDDVGDCSQIVRSSGPGIADYDIVCLSYSRKRSAVLQSDCTCDGTSCPTDFSEIINFNHGFFKGP
jgi:hypothetical protein